MTDTIFMLEPRLQEAIPQITEQNRHKSPNKIATNHRTKSPQITENVHLQKQAGKKHRTSSLPFLFVSAKNVEGMKDHRQTVKCEARNPCKVISNNRTLKG